MKTYLFPQPTEENPHIDPDYPYGFTLRCQRRVWREYRKGYGYRVCTQTSNPRKNNLVWNKPKKDNYWPVILFYIDSETGYIEHTAPHGFERECAEQAQAILNEIGENISDDDRARLNAFITLWEIKKAKGPITYSVTVKTYDTYGKLESVEKDSITVPVDTE